MIVVSLSNGIRVEDRNAAWHPPCFKALGECKNTMKPYLIAAAIAVAGATASQAITITSGNTPGVENVLFNEPGLINNGTTVQGQVGVGGPIVNFTSDELLTANGGQARIDADDGGLDNLAMSLVIGTMDLIVLSLDLPNGGGRPITGFVQFQVDNVNVNGPLPIGAGQNFFTIDGDGAGIGTLSFTTTVNLDNVRQIRIGVTGGGGNPNAVPDGGMTAMLLGLGFLGLAGARKIQK